MNISKSRHKIYLPALYQQQQILPAGEKDFAQLGYLDAHLKIKYNGKGSHYSQIKHLMQQKCGEITNYMLTLIQGNLQDYNFLTSCLNMLI